MAEQRKNKSKSGFATDLDNNTVKCKPNEHKKKPAKTFVPDLIEGELDDEHQSLEYEEDCYYSYLVENGTPSFDHCSPDELNICISDQDNDFSMVFTDDCVVVDHDSCSVETEFYSKDGPVGKSTNRKGVRVSFQDLSKPYLAKMSDSRNYRRFLDFVNAEEAPIDMSPDSGINELSGLTLEEQEQQKQEWQSELTKLEDEILTLRHVLASKMRQSQELKRKLGISVWKEVQDDISQGIRNVKESNVYQNVEGKIEQIGKAVADAPLYQKTESVIKTTAEKTTSLFGGLGSSMTEKIGKLKNSESFRSLEEKVGSAYENVKTKVGTSRSNSTQSFDEALREADRIQKSGTPASTPTIPEDRPVS